MKKQIFAFALILGLSFAFAAGGCNKKDDDNDTPTGGGCLSGTWNTLDECIQAKINAGVDDECDCKTDNWPDGPWYMVPDDK